MNHSNVKPLRWSRSKTLFLVFENDEAETAKLKETRANVAKLFQTCRGEKWPDKKKEFLANWVNKFQRFWNIETRSSPRLPIVGKVYGALSEMAKIAKIIMKHKDGEICNQICTLVGGPCDAIWTFKRCILQDITVEMMDGIVFHLKDIRKKKISETSTFQMLRHHPTPWWEWMSGRCGCVCILYFSEHEKEVPLW